MLIDGVCVLPSIPFEYSPATAALFVLRSTYFLYLNLSFDLRPRHKIKTALTFREARTINQPAAKSCISAV